MAVEEEQALSNQDVTVGLTGSVTGSIGTGSEVPLHFGEFRVAVQQNGQDSSGTVTENDGTLTYSVRGLATGPATVTVSGNEWFQEATREVSVVDGAVTRDQDVIVSNLGYLSGLVKAPAGRTFDDSNLNVRATDEQGSEVGSGLVTDVQATPRRTRRRLAGRHLHAEVR